MADLRIQLYKGKRQQRISTISKVPTTVLASETITETFNFRAQLTFNSFPSSRISLSQLTWRSRVLGQAPCSSTVCKTTVLTQCLSIASILKPLAFFLHCLTLQMKCPSQIYTHADTAFHVLISPGTLLLLKRVFIRLHIYVQFTTHCICIKLIQKADLNIKAL